jgi:uncharacterized YigZ family protein
MVTDFYNTIEQISTAEFKDRGSRFIAYAFPLAAKETFKEKLNEVKKEHPKASHHCFAYRIGTDGNNFRSGDDGEPSGSAGKPILGQIDSTGLTNVLIVVVRYFGGTMLGVPGLINAYKSAASMALQTTPVIQKAIEINYELLFDYNLINPVMNIVKQYNCTVHRQELQLFSRMLIGIPKNRLEEVLYKLKDLHSVEVKAAV